MQQKAANSITEAMYGQTFRIYLFDNTSCLKHGKPFVNSELAPRNNISISM